MCSLKILNTVIHMWASRESSSNQLLVFLSSVKGKYQVKELSCINTYGSISAQMQHS